MVRETKLGKQLRDYRTNNNLTQKQLATEVRAKTALIRDVENFRIIEPEHREKLEFVFDYSEINYTNKDIDELFVEAAKEAKTEMTPAAVLVNKVVEKSAEEKQEAPLPRVRELVAPAAKSIPGKEDLIKELEMLKLKDKIIDSLLDCFGSSDDDGYNRGILTSLQVIKTGFKKEEVDA